MTANAHTPKRLEMVENQIVARGITDSRVLDAMREVPREKFISTEFSARAYEDSPLPIEDGQTISQPYIVALMVEALDMSEHDRVLEIGAGSGYAAAVISRVAREVYAVERHAALANIATNRVSNLGYDNIHILCGDGSLGWPEFAPFDAILVSAGSPVVPDSLLRQLAIGGRLVIPVGDELSQQLLRITKTDATNFVRSTLCPVRFVPLIGREGW